MHNALDKETLSRLRDAVSGNNGADHDNTSQAQANSYLSISDQEIAKLAELVERARRVVLTCHIAPDGDAIGSTLGLGRVLQNMGKFVTVIPPDEAPKTLSIIPTFDRLMPFSRYGEKALDRFKTADLIFCLDFNALKRVDLLEPAVRGASAHKVMIDHHLLPEDFADITISEPGRSSTCQLVYEVLRVLGLDCYIDAEAASSLLAGMMTDTGNFSYSANDPRTYHIVADLIAHGADKVTLTKALFDTFSENCLRIQGYALSQKMKLWPEHHAAMVTLTREELNNMHYAKGDTEGLVNKPLCIPGIIYSVYFREETDYIKVSMRSVGDFPVDQICADHFGGGGHKNAAGGEFRGTMDEAMTLFESLLEKNSATYINNN
jgi:phosphoesterase RecJ-like protein